MLNYSRNILDYWLISPRGPLIIEVKSFVASLLASGVGVVELVLVNICHCLISQSRLFCTLEFHISEAFLIKSPKLLSLDTLS